MYIYTYMDPICVSQLLTKATIPLKKHFGRTFHEVKSSVTSPLVHLFAEWTTTPLGFLVVRS